MAYQFSGFFAMPIQSKPLRLPEDAVWRVIETPFSGVGVRLPSLLGKCPPLSEVAPLARSLGFDGVEAWLFLTYDCFGSIDFVYGLGRRGDRHFGPVEESNLSRVESVYHALLESFGVSAEDAMKFPPFERGYWGEA